MRYRPYLPTFEAAQYLGVTDSRLGSKCVFHFDNEDNNEPQWFINLVDKGLIYLDDSREKLMVVINDHPYKVDATDYILYDRKTKMLVVISVDELSVGYNRID